MKVIPLVVHIVYERLVQNISDEQIKSQIDILNQDYARRNPDAANTPNEFKPSAVDTGIQFCLVKVIRTQTNVKEFTDNSVKSCSTGGSDALDTTKYMNIWVCNLGKGLLGYAEFPNTQASNTYGVVMNYQAFGNTGTARAPYNKGRTLTHEIAHCLNVRHIFEEGVPATQCSKTDYCLDIPTQKNKNFGCPTFPKTEDCAINSPGVMFMNYMDYVDDACMNVFTKDQAARMNATLSIAPYDKLSLTGCAQNTEAVCKPAGVVEKDQVEQLIEQIEQMDVKTFAVALVGFLLLLVIIALMIPRKK
jgi:Pregnancy-associated plasma protein-A